MIVSRSKASVDAVARHYDELDHWYQVIWGEHVHHGLFESRRETIPEATEKLIELLARELDPKPGDLLCDVGCGYGGTARYLAENFGAHVTGVTVSTAQAEYAQEHSAQGVDIRVCDFLKSDFDDKYFDIVMSIESTEHFDDKSQLFAELFRILKPGGRIGVFAWLSKHNPAPWEVRWLLEPICREGHLPGIGDQDEYQQLLQDAGFASLDFTDLSNSVKRTWTLVIRRIANQLLVNQEARSFIRSGFSNTAFLKTLFRIRLAYALGSMRYGLFTAVKPKDSC